MAKQKFYVVWEGLQTGVFDSWSEAGAQVQGYASAKYKSFSTRAEAEKAFKLSYWTVIGKDNKPAQQSRTYTSSAEIIADSLAVDAACSGNPGDMEYQGVHVKTGQRIFHVGPLPEGTNNVGEFLALVHGLAWLAQQGTPNVPVYTDSRNAMLWIKAKKCRTKLAQTTRNKPIFDLIFRAEKWLANNKVTNPILKWETEDWGEIPADFGRK